MTEDLTAHLAGLRRAMAAPLPSPEELAAGKAEDRAMAERIHKARPGVPTHHAYAVLETLRTLQHVDEAKTEPAMTAHPVLGSPIRHALIEAGIIAAEDSALQAVRKIRAFETVRDRVTGSTSDGFHTFDELYHHRTILTAMLLNQLPGLDPWKARQHHDGTMYDGFFIVGADTQGGQATYHCRDRYWDLFDIEERDRAPEFDGHTPDDTLSRLFLDVIGRELEVRP